MLDSISRSSNWWEFWRKRALRIVPALLAAIALSGFVWGWSEGVVGSIKTYLGGGHLLGSQGNGSLWSLLWEEMAYGLMAILVSVGAYRRPMIIWISFALSCLIAYLNNQHGNTWQFTNLAPGLFTGNLVRMYRKGVESLNWLWVLVTTIIISVAIRYSHIPPQSWFMVPIGAFLALTLCLTSPRMPSLPGDFSYGIYVYHDPIFSFSSKLYPHSFDSIVCSGMPCLLGAACLSWFLLEKPALKLKAKSRSRNRYDAVVIPDNAGR